MKKLTVQKGFTKHQFKKIVEFRKTGAGFTLIELLVVIAVLGILAAVILVGINPLEQIARGKDASRKSAVAQLGHAMESYVTSNAGAAGSNAYPIDSETWQDDYLVTSGFIKTAVSTADLNSNCTVNNDGNFCYQTNGTQAVIWTLVESTAEKQRAGGTCATDPATNYAAAVWVSSQGKAGVACLGTSAATAPSYTAAPN